MGIYLARAESALLHSWDKKLSKRHIDNARGIIANCWCDDRHQLAACVDQATRHHLWAEQLKSLFFCRHLFVKKHTTNHDQKMMRRKALCANRQINMGMSPAVGKHCRSRPGEVARLTWRALQPHSSRRATRLPVDTGRSSCWAWVTNSTAAVSCFLPK